MIDDGQINSGRTSFSSQVKNFFGVSLALFEIFPRQGKDM